MRSSTLMFVAATAVSISMLLSVSSSVVSAQPQFVAAALQTSQSLPGYTLASINDLYSEEFLEQYEASGINFVQPLLSMCCVVTVAEGFLAIQYSESNNSYFEPFLPNQGGDTCTTGMTPNGTIFGVPVFAGGPFAGVSFPQLTPKVLGMIVATSVNPPSAVYGFECMAGTSYALIGVYKQAEPTMITMTLTVPLPVTTTSSLPLPAPTRSYLVQPFGPNYPAPYGYRHMFVEDLTTPDFIRHYNAEGGVFLTNIGQTNYCCMIRVADGGWLTYGAENHYSPLTLLTESFSWQCGLPTNNQMHYFGTFFGGNVSVTLMDLNSTTVQLFGFMTNDTYNYDNCNAFPDSLALFVKASV